uniref:Uncharacterized protein n=1 Tax=Pristionchus pacificus TaxID=54126 RepID=A0A2A6C4S2_PRIPA|eukprot:PDM73222.1 hypothetical protein PRIPAC_40578 [Pristionchus pacificus]
MTIMTKYRCPSSFCHVSAWAAHASMQMEPEKHDSRPSERRGLPSARAAAAQSRSLTRVRLHDTARLCIVYLIITVARLKNEYGSSHCVRVRHAADAEQKEADALARVQ